MIINSAQNRAALSHQKYICRLRTQPAKGGGFVPPFLSAINMAKPPIERLKTFISEFKKESFGLY